MKSHKDLKVWQNSISLARAIYEITRGFPREETFSLSDQMKRSAISIASNIAEGAARQTNKEFVQFLYIALGSASELDTQIEICKTLSCEGVQKERLNAVQDDINSISRMIQRLIATVKKKPSRTSSRSPITNH